MANHEVDLNDIQQTIKQMESDLLGNVSGLGNLMKQFQEVSKDAIPTEIFTFENDGRKAVIERFGKKVSVTFETEQEAIDHILDLKENAG